MRLNIKICHVLGRSMEGTVIQIEKALINDRIRVSKVS